MKKRGLACAFGVGALLMTLLAGMPAAGAGASAAAGQTVVAFDQDLPRASARCRRRRRRMARSWREPRGSAPFTPQIRADPAYSSRVDGSQFCSGSGYAATKITVKVQRHRWYRWQTMRSQSTGWSSSGFIELVDVGYDCSGDGTYTYRIVTTGYANGGLYSQSVQSLNYLRVSC